MKITLLLSLIIFSSYTLAEESDWDHWKDFKTSFGYLVRGSYLQFTEPSVWIAAPLGTGALAYSFHHDARLANKYKGKKVNGFVDAIGEIAAIAATPIMPLAFYETSKLLKDPKLKQFSMELLSSVYLAMGEAALLSLIRIHERPNSEELGFWETAFRGDSSFPSGHIMSYAALTFKTFQFYGTWWAIPPAILTYLGAKQRIESRRHYLSDVVGGILITFFASEGVRKAANNKKNSLAYKLIFEHNFRATMIHQRDISGIQLSLSY